MGRPVMAETLDELLPEERRLVLAAMERFEDELDQARGTFLQAVGDLLEMPCDRDPRSLSVARVDVGDVFLCVGDAVQLLKLMREGCDGRA